MGKQSRVIHDRVAPRHPNNLTMTINNHDCRMRQPYPGFVPSSPVAHPDRTTATLRIGELVLRVTGRFYAGTGEPGNESEWDDVRLSGDGDEWTPEGDELEQAEAALTEAREQGAYDAAVLRREEDTL